MLGWGATDKTGEQSQFPRQVDLRLNKTTDCDCREQYILETNVGEDNEDTCTGDSGQTSCVIPSVLFGMVFVGSSILSFSLLEPLR